MFYCYYNIQFNITMSNSQNEISSGSYTAEVVPLTLDGLIKLSTATKSHYLNILNIHVNGDTNTLDTFVKKRLLNPMCTNEIVLFYKTIEKN